MQTATRVKRSRLEKGWTLRELAQKCDDAGAPITYSQLSKIELGYAVPRPVLRRALAALLGLDIDDFQRKAA